MNNDQSNTWKEINRWRNCRDYYTEQAQNSEGAEKAEWEASAQACEKVAKNFIEKLDPKYAKFFR